MIKKKFAYTGMLHSACKKLQMLLKCYIDYFFLTSHFMLYLANLAMLLYDVQLQ